MKPIRVDFDAQLLLEPQKTGIGMMAYNTLYALAGDEAMKGSLNVFTMRKKRGYERQWAEIQKLCDKGLKLRKCSWFHDVLYKMLWNFIPIPYSLFFGANADVTHFFNYYIPPGVKGKRVTTVCDMVFCAFPETMNAKTRAMLQLSLKKSVKRAHRIVTISEFSKSEILRYLNVPEQKVTVIPCGVDLEAFHPDIPAQEIERVRQTYGLAARYFLYLGTLEPRKNLVRLIEAYARLHEMRTDVPALCIAGRKGWQFEEIFEAVKRNNLEDHVIFTGYVPQQDAPPLISGALAFVFPSLYEGFGLPPLEAMACGTPVIASSAASLPEVVQDAGILVDPLNVGLIANAMETLMDDALLCQKLSEAGRQRALTFTWERTAQELLKVYQQLIREDES